jgi:hypothetical protein
MHLGGEKLKSLKTQLKTLGDQKQEGIFALDFEYQKAFL